MPAKPIPEGHHAVTPYLVVEKAPKLIDFMKQAFGAEEAFRFAMPDGKIMHAEVKIGDSCIMIGEASDQHKPMPSMIHLYVTDPDAVYQRAIAAGATSMMEVSDQFYGDRSGGVKDSWGNHWWIATHKEDLSMDEIGRRAQAAMKQRQGA